MRRDDFFCFSRVEKGWFWVRMRFWKIGWRVGEGRSGVCKGDQGGGVSGTREDLVPGSLGRAYFFRISGEFCRA